ncbi:unnamed protein product [Penicillium pancosmium]
MSFAAAIRSRVARPRSIFSISHPSRTCYHQLPQSGSTRGTPSISVAASFPDDFESSLLASDLPEESKSMARWEEALATLSEAAVKADRGDIRFNMQSRVKKTETPSMENREPELDEM